jgi:dihydroorotate dehydrogenase (fumarate)/dihydroorotate dehydrogenase
MNLYKHLLRPLLFRLDPETAHSLTVEACRIGGRIPLFPQAMKALFTYSSPELQCDVAGMKFANPVGMAAGWDKSGRALRMIDHLGFGFAEIGSISARASAGNPRPRLFRLPNERAIVVNYGLPNDGAHIVAQRLAKYRSSVPLGVNIVKTNDGLDALDCDEEAIVADYQQSVSLVHRHADYITLNLSCPNAKGGINHFADRGTIASLLKRLATINITCPVFLKVAPDPDPENLARLIEETLPWNFVRGFIFNLPSGKPATLRFASASLNLQAMPGAVAGKPVEPLINRCVRELYARMPPNRFVIIGAGGVFSADDAYQKIRNGASLVQIYSAMIYEGPGVVSHINSGLVKLLRRDGFSNVQEAVGSKG